MLACRERARMMNASRRVSRWAVGLGAAAIVLTACGRAGEYCEEMCDCELCNDRKMDECIIQIDTTLDVTGAYDCDDDYDKYLQCRIDRAVCDNHNWRVENNACDTEQTRYVECVRAASGLQVIGDQTCVCTCTCETGQTAAICQGVGCCESTCFTQCLTDGLGNFLGGAGEICQ